MPSGAVQYVTVVVYLRVAELCCQIPSQLQHAGDTAAAPVHIVQYSTVH